MAAAKELLWLDDEDQVIAATISLFYLLRGPNPEQLIVHIFAQTCILPDKQVWVLGAMGRLTEYSVSLVVVLSPLWAWEICLLPHGHPGPIPAAIVRYVNGVLSLHNTPEKDEDTPC